MIKDPASLEYQTAIIPLRQGLDLKTAVQVVDAPAMLGLSNVTLHAPGEIAKDRGYQFLPTTDLAGVAMPAQFRRFVEHNSAQLIVGRDNLAERSETVDAFHVPANRTAIASSSAERLISLDPNGTPSSQPSMAHSGGYDMIAAIYGGLTLRVLVRERSTGTIMSTFAVAVAAAGQHPICISVGTNLICLWADGANLRATRWSTAAAGVPLSAPVNLAVNVNAAAKFIDAVGGAATGYVAYTNVTPAVTCLRFDPVTLVVAGFGVIAGAATNGVAVCLDATENQLIAWAGAGGLSVFGLTPIGAARGNSLLSANAHTAIACVSNENATGRGTVFGRNGVTNGAARYQVAFTGAGGSLGSNTLFGWTPAHKPVLVDQMIFAGYYWDHPAAGSAFAIEYTACTVAHRADNGQTATADPICWYSYGTALAGGIGIPPVATLTLVDGEYIWPWTAIDPLLTQPLTISGLILHKLRPYDGQSAPLRRQPYVCNAIANGQTGFFDASIGNAPRTSNLNQQNTGASLVSGQTYNWIAWYEIRLPDGTQVRSLTSLVRTATITGANNQVTFDVSTPLHREGLTCYVRVARTLAGGTVFHTLPLSTAAIAATARTAHTVTFTDGDSDANVAGYPLLYTTGGVLDAYPQPMTRVLVLHQGRVFGIDENSNQLRYTREVIDGEAPAWHPSLSLDCTGTNMDPRCLITSPQGMWVLGRDRSTGAGAIALLLGTGPTDSGQGSTYELQRLENCDVGPDGYRKAVSTPVGILFEDPNQGFHLLPTGGGQPVFVGAPIEAQRRTVLCLHVLHDRKEVRVTQNGGVPNLSWHYDQNQWSTRGMPSAVTILDATVWDHRHVLLASFAMARQENGFFGDPLAGYQVTSLTTAWIKSASFSGLQRIWRLYLLGRNIAPHGLTLTLQYNYDETTPGDVYTFSEAEVAAAVASGKYEFRISPRRQLCESFRVTVADTAGSSGSGQGAAWVALRLEYGALRASSRKVGSARKS